MEDKVANVEVAEASWKEALDKNNMSYLRNLIEEKIIGKVDYQPTSNYQEYNPLTEKYETTYRNQALIRVLNPNFAGPKEQKKFVKRLLKNGADPNLRGSQYTPLEKAVLGDLLDIVEMMIDFLKKANKSITDARPFYYAIDKGFDEIINYFVKNEFLTDKYKNGDTILLYVLRDSNKLSVWRKLEIVKLLLESDNVKNNINAKYNNQSALSIAKKQKSSSVHHEYKAWKKIVSALEEAGAKI